jgi:hypothetical protein
MCDNGSQIVKMRLPSERGADTVASRYDLSGVTRPSVRELDYEVGPGHVAGDQKRHPTGPLACSAISGRYPMRIGSSGVVARFRAGDKPAVPK